MLLISAAALAMLPLPGQATMTDVPTAEVQLDLAPDQAKYDPDDRELRAAAQLLQGKLAEALVDYNTSIALCPYSPDPVLNRGVVLEALGRFPEAVADYQAVLRATPADPAAGKRKGMGQWQEALAYYSKAVELAPGFSFASANRALALYQLGQAEQAIREMRNLLRRYSSFTDMRAALAAALWGAGLEGQAEIQW
ncbi:TPR_REGION domain-containing protein [Haematococcus lacustris]|uniref:TPR_REGION domain-containing protein n=1 Tax=Haematococcus lacustris TaxID=44745 RepID=A0A6A0A082_HAELA|nr:TPR_REGION domain-containing protein [Haematococcus lacustris]